MKRTHALSISILVAGLILLTSSFANALMISGSAEAFGIDWTLSATDDVDAAYAADYDIMFSLRADVPDDLTLIMDEGETITPTWISIAEGRIAGLQEHRLVSAPNGAGGWLDLSGPSANNCQDRHTQNSACAQSTSDAYSADITAGVSHTWTWVGNVASLDRVFAEDMSGLQHIGAHLENVRHRNGWNVSEGVSNPVPEPSAALVFGFGILAAGVGVRRGQNQAV